ncbi:MAG TPA: hypothetical protein VFU38_08560 [Candidatus Krumholzibacteria bacterium]|nr:hypothetical protein [Candidatus Krumholzibacteria bacterium]
MKHTRLFLLASLLVAVIYASGAALAGVPNIELITALAFVSGYLLGPGLGALVGAAGMGAHSLFNPLGAVAPPVWVSQMAAFALIGWAGGVWGPKIARMRIPRAAVVSAMLGVLLVLIYQIAVNVVAFYTFTSDVDVWVYVWGGIAFGVVQLTWNAVVFGVAVPPMLRVLARHRRQMHGQAATVPPVDAGHKR